MPVLRNPASPEPVTSEAPAPPGPERDALVAEVQAYLKSHHVMTVATVGDGLPQAADVFYASDGFTLYFVSDPSTRHGANIARQPQVAVTIHEDYDDWRQIQGLQIEGPARLVSSKLELVKAMAVYLAKYPWARPFLASPAAISAQVARKTSGIRFYKVSPHWVRFVDNSKGFGHHEELILAHPS